MEFRIMNQHSAMRQSQQKQKESRAGHCSAAPATHRTLTVRPMMSYLLVDCSRKTFKNATTVAWVKCKSELLYKVMGGGSGWR